MASGERTITDPTASSEWSAGGVPFGGCGGRAVVKPG